MIRANGTPPSKLSTRNHFERLISGIDGRLFVYGNDASLDMTHVAAGA